jgi:prepilin-type processing-associated H-X9-DG protein
MKLHVRSRSRGFTLRDMLVLLFVFAMLVISVIGCRRHTGEGASRVKCASNLRQIGQALLLYANENNGNFPRTTYVGGDAVRPTWGTGAAASNPFDPDGPAANDVTAAMFLLLRTRDITPEVFVCPKTPQMKDDFGGGGKTVAQRSNFTDWSTNSSYSYANPYPNAAAEKAGYRLNSSLTAEFAVASDRSPGMIHDARNVTTVTMDSNAGEMVYANSTNHDGDGQNVLYGDGHVEYVNTPFVGIARDNIFTSKLGNTIVESPEGPTDSVLLPPEK